MSYPNNNSDQPKPKNCIEKNTRIKASDNTTVTATPTATTTTSTTAIITPKSTVDQMYHQNCTEKDATSETEINNNNNDNPVKANDSHIPGPSDYLLEKQEVAAEVE